MIDVLDGPTADEVLARGTVGRIGCRYGESAYVVPVTYAYDDGTIYGHSADGLKLRLMREAPRVCFEVEEITDLGTWSSVVAWGTFTELEGDAAAAAMRRLVEHVRPNAQPSSSAHPQSHGKGGSATLWSITLDTVTGRSEHGA